MQNWIIQLDFLKRNAEKEIMLSDSEQDLLKVRIKYLGRKGLVTSILRNLKEIPIKCRIKVGKYANDIKNYLLNKINKLVLEKNIKYKTSISQHQYKIDLTLPGRKIRIGKVHPISQILEEIKKIFLRIGFNIASGPEVEYDYYNFEALNMPKNHPARNMQDTFYIQENILLRTHTSSVQVRILEKECPPISFIVPGKVYRRDLDISHTPMFHQVEGILIDKNINFGNLKEIITSFIYSIFNKDISLRFRPSFFPFTEPSAEIDIQCIFCKGSGCNVCKQSGWIEILGAGMIDQSILKLMKNNCSNKNYTGFAFGMGVERIAMLKFGISDIRLFFDNDLRFLMQF